MMTQSWLFRVFTSRHRWLSVLATWLLCAGAAVIIGYLLAEFGVVVAAAGLAGLLAGLWVLGGIERAYLAVIGVVCLLPFASFPIDIGFTPTLLDAALGALFFIWIVRVATGKQREFIGTPLALPVTVFILLAIGAFVFGLAHAPLTSYLVRHFAEVMLSIAMFFLVVNTVRDIERLERIVRMLIVCTFVTAVVGIALYVIADQVSRDLAIRALSALGRLKYPTGPGVLRYIMEDPERPLRATSTSVDPNVLGSLLNIVVAIAVPQLFARHPIFRRRYLLPMLGATALCLGLTLSRGALVSMSVALVIIATLRYRRLWLMLSGGAVLILLLPQTQSYVAHLITGFRVGDLATQMRFGEYKDALILIGRYPWFGVGFGASPDIDTYIGVSNVYLLIAEQMGLIGLGSFLSVILVFLISFWRNRSRAAMSPRLEPLWWGLHAGIMGALVGGLVDHYFFNLDFHHSVTLFWLVIALATTATTLIGRRECDDARQPAGR
ncbi:MAG: hypothetical protein GX620_07155 [Chloroflexi bacterium]|nr:hypothetical protein [Chloroflexota bacterium]